MKVFLNPGHAPNGDPDPGACGNGLRECDVAKNISDLSAKYLTAAGVDVVGNLQDNDLDCVIDAANNSGADFFMSIHCNDYVDSNAKGTEVFAYSLGSKGALLAERIQRQIVDSLGAVDRGVKTANFYVIRHTDMPAILIETAFISNADDAAKLRDKQDDFARAIARGVTDYLRGTMQPAKEKPPDGMLSEHFAASEFVCHCCGAGADKINPRLVELLEQLRWNIGGLPLHINSGYRCAEHNADVGGVPNSQHVLGTAADVARPHGLSFGQFKWYVKQLPFDGIGYYPDSDFIHTDVRDGGIGSHIEWEG